MKYIKWKKKEKIWSVVIPKHLRKTSDFFQCPICNQKYKSGLDFGINYNYDMKEIEFIEFRCIYCTESFKLEDFSEKTKNYLNNFVIRDIWELFFIPYILKYKIKEGRTTNISISELKTAFENQDKSIKFKCGNCNSSLKNHFRLLNESENIYECSKCGYLNKFLLLHDI